MGLLLIGKIKVLTFFRVALSDLFIACRATPCAMTLLLQLYYLLVVFRGYFGGGGLRYVC